MIDKHLKGEPEFIPDTALLPEGAGKEIRQSQGVKSFLSQSKTAFIGFVIGSSACANLLKTGIKGAKPSFKP